MRYGKRCEGCSGEDCACCAVYLEHRAEMQAAAETGQYYPPDDYDWSEYDWEHDPE
jgi:hypothetical protein